MTEQGRKNSKAEYIQVRGRVQGVGFRPFVWQLARELGLSGHVFNDVQGVSIQVRGSPNRLEQFARRLESQAPPLAEVESIERTTLDSDEYPAHSSRSFQILPSPPGARGKQLTAIPPDIVSCLACTKEISEPDMRRYRYPFTNCTHCGPRLTIIKELPYDRARTEMATFQMCDQCRSEYRDPGDRRYHAQPIACPACGPRAWLSDQRGRELDPRNFVAAGDVIRAAAALLKQGAILALKGLGGFQLACDAGNELAVARLRQRKQRPDKPFALMFPDLNQAESCCRISVTAVRALRSPHGPIVLLPRKAADATQLAPGIAQGLNELGIMLPGTPLHLLLLRDFNGPLVMTSGNRSNEPQCIDNQQALDKLRWIADYWLLHDRKILCRVDDSVLRDHSVYSLEGTLQMLRHARGYAPHSFRLPRSLRPVSAQILALGSQEKASLAFIHGDQLVLSQYLGNLAEPGNWQDFQRNLRHYQQLYRLKPEVLAIDQHPEYLNSKYARELAGQFPSSGYNSAVSATGGLSLDHAPEIEEVQHHHAHLAACMLEHGLEGRTVIGVLLDGLGYGTDRREDEQNQACQLWGMEFLLGGYAQAERVASLQAVPLMGGALAAKEPWRCLLAWLLQLCPSSAVDSQQKAARITGSELQQLVADWQISDCLPQLSVPQLELLLHGAHNGSFPQSSSAGRLFDAVAALLLAKADGPLCTSYDGQAAIELEALAQKYLYEQRLIGAGFSSMTGLLTERIAQYLEPYPYHLAEFATANSEQNFLELQLTPMWPVLLQDWLSREEQGYCALRFHWTLAQAICKICCNLAETAWRPAAEQGEPVAPELILSGGVFQNALLLKLCRELLQQYGAAKRRQGAAVLGQVYSPVQFPANDGGLALGQAAVAAARRVGSFVDQTTD